MGHIKVIYYNTKFNKLFFRRDGGSNGYDREFNYNAMKELSKINNHDILSRSPRKYNWLKIQNQILQHLIYRSCRFYQIMATISILQEIFLYCLKTMF